jgi:hypothetical protein
VARAVPDRRIKARGHRSGHPAPLVRLPSPVGPRRPVSFSKIETGERPPAEDFPPRPDAVPELDTRGALTRLWDHLKKGHKQRLDGWFQQWADIEAQATVLRWYEPLVVPGLLQTEEYARAILSARPDGNLDDLDGQVAARLARQAILDRTGPPSSGASSTRASCTAPSAAARPAAAHVTSG